MIIDAHMHIAISEIKPKELTFEQVLKSLLREMKSSRVDYALAIAYYKQTNFNLSLAEELKLIQGIKKLGAIGTLDLLNYRKIDLELLDELLNKKIIKGIKLNLGYQHIYPNDKRCGPIYKLCIKHDVPAVFHTGDTLDMPGEPAAKIKYTHPIHIDDVASDFPDLKMIIAHIGNPWLIDCAEVLYKNKNVYADISGLVIKDSDLNSPYGVLMKKRIQELYIYSDPRKLLYGTDWPLASMKTYIQFTKNLGLSKMDLDYVFYKNAMRLFKL